MAPLASPGPPARSAGLRVDRGRARRLVRRDGPDRDPVEVRDLVRAAAAEQAARTESGLHPSVRESLDDYYADGDPTHLEATTFRAVRDRAVDEVSP